MRKISDKGKKMEGMGGQIRAEKCIMLMSIAVCVGKVNKGDFCRVNDGQSVMEGERERDLINQVNPFLRSSVVSVEMQFEKGFRQPVLNRVYLESTVDIPQVYNECLIVSAAKYLI